MIAAVAAVLAVALVLDRESDPAPPAASFSAADVARVARRVEKLRGLRFERPVRPLFLDRDEAVALARRISRSEYSEAAQRVDEEGLKLLGLLRPGTDLRAAVDSVEQEQVLGFYDDRSQRLVVIRDPGATRPLLEITLAHELVHALEDQRFGLDVPDGVPDDDALAESALAEGTATALMIDYAGRYMDLRDVLALASQSDGESLPPFLEKLLLFPYLEGEKFVNEFRGERKSWRPIDAIYRFRRPRSSEQILHPRRYALGEHAERVPAPALGAGARTGMAAVEGNHAGGVRPAAAVRPRRRHAAGGRCGRVGRGALRAVAQRPAGRGLCGPVRGTRRGLRARAVGQRARAGGGRAAVREGVRRRACTASRSPAVRRRGRGRAAAA